MRVCALQYPFVGCAPPLVEFDDKVNKRLIRTELFLCCVAPLEEVVDRLATFYVRHCQLDLRGGNAFTCTHVIKIVMSVLVNSDKETAVMSLWEL